MFKRIRLPQIVLNIAVAAILFFLVCSGCSNDASSSTQSTSNDSSSTQSTSNSITTKFDYQDVQGTLHHNSTVVVTVPGENTATVKLDGTGAETLSPQTFSVNSASHSTLVTIKDTSKDGKRKQCTLTIDIQVAESYKTTVTQSSWELTSY